MRKRKILNGYSNCYEGDCRFCHDVTCQVERGYQQEEYEQFTAEDYKKHITDLAKLLLNEGADGLMRHFGTLLGRKDDRLVCWAIENCRNDELLAEFAKHMPSEWKDSPYTSDVHFLLSKIEDERTLAGLVLWASDKEYEGKLMRCAIERLCNKEIAEELLKTQGAHISYVKRRLEEMNNNPFEKYYDEWQDEYDCEGEDEAAELPELSQEELFEAAKNYMDIDSAEEAVYRLTDMTLLAELAAGMW